MSRPPVTSRVLLLAVVVTVLLAGGPGSGVAAASTGGPPFVPQQVDVTVDEFEGTVALGGRVTGDPTAPEGEVGAAGRFLGTATVALGRTNLVATATVNASVVSDVDDVLGTAMTQGSLNASVSWLNQTYSIARNATLPSLLPVAPVVATGAPPGSGIQQAGLLPVASGVLLPMQATGAGWFTVTIWDIYGFMVNLLLGLVLIGVFPRFSNRVSVGAARDVFQSGGVGLAVLVATPLILLLFALSLFGLPIALVGGLLFVVVSWIGAIYGRFAIGVWLLDVVPRQLAFVGAKGDRSRTAGPPCSSGWWWWGWLSASRIWGSSSTSWSSPLVSARLRRSASRPTVGPNAPRRPARPRLSSQTTRDPSPPPESLSI
ncbi:hypothetical protein [Salinigranum marinum]|uniref:hypothetical protein n=1 Tax=Salinigranum marinum TaxID=1515595 RepID=UPI002989D020|nr:hypothetical protein [Salinigranum marinum]